MSRVSLESVDWEFIKQSIENQKCILCIGTDAYKGTQKSVYQEVLDKIVQRFPQDSELYAEEELLFFREPTIRTRAYATVSNLYEEAQAIPQPILDKLVQIDFHLIINLSPDTYLQHIFERYNVQGLETQFDFYQMGQPVADLKKPSKERPLVYNLFGSAEHSKSLVFTHDDIFEFIFSILRTHELHNNLKNAILEAECFLFVGGQLDQWYIKTLLQLLKFLNKETVKYATSLKDHTNEKFYYQIARLEFIDNQEAWVDMLYTKCQQANLLRKLGAEAKVSHKKELLEFLDTVNYVGFFAKIDELGIESMEMSTFKMAFIKGRIDLNFEERLRVYVQSLDI
jgi:hypothetical protein